MDAIEHGEEWAINDTLWWFQPNHFINQEGQNLGEMYRNLEIKFSRALKNTPINSWTFNDT